MFRRQLTNSLRKQKFQSLMSVNSFPIIPVFTNIYDIFVILLLVEIKEKEEDNDHEAQFYFELNVLSQFSPKSSSFLEYYQNKIL